MYDQIYRYCSKSVLSDHDLFDLIEKTRGNLYLNLYININIIQMFLMFCHIHFHLKKTLMIPKAWPEAVNRRRTNNKKVKRKETRGQTMIYKTIHSKLKIEQRGVLDITLCNKGVSDMRQVGSFLRVPRFPPSITLTATI